jgi:predicted nuclease of predicted toxin-antitoxin system
MRFLVDAQLPPALARWIEGQGFVAEHVFDSLGVNAADRTIWDYAARIDAFIISKDEDFFTLRTVNEIGPGLIWIRVGNTRKQVLLDWFGRLFPEILENLRAGETLIEIGP